MKKYERGTPQIDAKYKITIVEHGPYLVFGKPPIKTQTILVNENDNSWEFFEGRKDFTFEKEPTPLCRCGHSKNKPYCDGSHEKVEWDSTLTASHRALLESAEVQEGPNLILTDNERYCAFARFCDAKGRTWNQVANSDDPHQRDLAIRTSGLCPAGRLKTWNKQTGEPYEIHFEPSIGLIEDEPLGNSGGIWVRGGIPIIDPNGFIYEVRNRVTLCRCGESQNKPFCDGTHTAMKFHDQIPKEK